MQVIDDLELLSIMMEDMNVADELYKPTNYWSFYEKHFLPELESIGLHNFRKRDDSVLSTFAATDLLPKTSFRYKGNLRIRGINRVLKYLSKNLDRFNIQIKNNYFKESITPYFYNYVSKKFIEKSFNLLECPTSNIGNPEDKYIVEGTLWTFKHLQYCSMFIDTVNYIKYSEKMVFCELGPGLGRNIEILAQLYPSWTFIIFDIPPQLYISNQYLSSVFGDRVINYSDSKNINSDLFNDLQKDYIGKIIILPTWEMPHWSNTKIDIFWNSASFQEMEPDVVANYINHVRDMQPEYIYINAMPEGNYHGDWRLGRGGTKKPVLSKYFKEPLSYNYKLIKEYYTEYFLREDRYKSYIYQLKNEY